MNTLFVPATLQTIREQLKLRPEDLSPDGQIHEGLRADAVLRLPGYGQKDAIKPPARREDGTFRWYYRHSTVVFRYLDGHYRVVGIEPPEIKKLSKKARGRSRR